ncbi:uncharacterized protein EV422DRAFT_403566 [Fimicolochytrium jonesii]|uniref:uncharacterized protein n=1 Tax=Fimicolochytrium jonesii TaxID=1396493 RepID=UPI0022FECF32|nr:uncharacterized protein EV422DRAFT_403566 [Fimicolochytrium jonesii]KAI8822557.1 hypothetical protein EV422DRAFT_403566 [Fimicolochytrium jonesii]
MDISDLDKIKDSLQKDLSMASHSDFRGHCERCGEPVLNDTGPGVSYSQDNISHSFHRKCFLCAGCNNSIVDEFFMHGDKPHGKPYCKACYEKLLGSCSKCQLSLIGSEIILAGKSAKFHPQCFLCFKCKSPLQARYFQQDDHHYCRTCYEEKFTPECARCTQKILPDQASKIAMVEWKDKKFHQDCFRCKKCDTPFTDLKALHHIGELYCEACYFVVIKEMDISIVAAESGGAGKGKRP